MLVYGGLVVGAMVAVAVFAAGARGAEQAKDLVAGGDFAAAGQGDLPAEWKVWTPLWKGAACAVRPTAQGLLVEPSKEPFGVGGVTQTLAGVKGGQAYAVRAEAEVRDVAAPYQSLLVRLNWTQGGKPLHPAGWLVRARQAAGPAAVFEDVLAAPPEADGATLTLEVKWPGRGSVLWKRVSVRPTQAPPPRKVKIGTVYLRPKNSTPEKNLDLWCAQIDAAGQLGLDAVCLGEAILQVGTAKDVAALAEPVPGPTTERLGAAARKNKLWVVAGITEREGDRIYNTAVLLGRDGRLAGKYRKIHLPREEWLKGITPGAEYPVFETDFGKVAIMICYDWFFPEAAEIFALRGAEVLFAPTWGNTLPDSPDGCVDGENTFRVRARDNGLYLVPSVYDGSSMVIDPMGRIRASNKGQEGVFWAEVDLSTRERLPWVGEWRSIGPRDRMPRTYGPMAAEPTAPPLQ